MDEDNTLAALKLFGGTPQQLEQARADLEARRRTDEFGIWPENWRAWELFVNSKWTIVAGAAGAFHTGIASSEFESVDRRLPPDADAELPDARTLFLQLRILESEALPHLNKRG